MRYNIIDLMKAVKDSAGNIFNIDWINNTGKSPITGEVVIGPTSTATFFGIDFFASPILTGTSKRFLLITPNTLTRIHLGVAALSASNLQIFTYEGTTVSSNGSALTAINRDRNDATAATLSVFQDPVIVSDGTQIKFDTNIGQVSRFDEITHVNELILKQNTMYELVITNVTASSLSALVKFIWAEIS